MFLRPRWFRNDRGLRWCVLTIWRSMNRAVGSLASYQAKPGMSPIVLVFGRRDDDTIHALLRRRKGEEP
jgi:hypothetical protein